MSRLTVDGIGPGEADYILPAVIKKMKKAHTVNLLILPSAVILIFLPFIVQLSFIIQVALHHYFLQAESTSSTFLLAARTSFCPSRKIIPTLAGLSRDGKD